MLLPLLSAVGVTAYAHRARRTLPRPKDVLLIKNAYTAAGITGFASLVVLASQPTLPADPRLRAPAGVEHRPGGAACARRCVTHHSYGAADRSRTVGRRDDALVGRPAPARPSRLLRLDRRPLCGRGRGSVADPVAVLALRATGGVGLEEAREIGRVHDGHDGAVVAVGVAVAVRVFLEKAREVGGVHGRGRRAA